MASNDPNKTPQKKKAIINIADLIGPGPDSDVAKPPGYQSGMKREYGHLPPLPQVSMQYTSSPGPVGFESLYSEGALDVGTSKQFSGVGNMLGGQPAMGTLGKKSTNIAGETQEKNFGSTATMVDSLDTFNLTGLPSLSFPSTDEGYAFAKKHNEFGTTSQGKTGITFIDDPSLSPLNKELSKTGCKMCSKHATCVTRGLVGEISPQHINVISHIEQDQFRDADPLATLREEEELRDVIKQSKMEVTYDEAKGPFCCGSDGHGELKHDIRTSGILLPDDLHQPIHEFMTTVNAGLVAHSIDSLSEGELKEIKTILKVNIREDHEDKYTVLFAPTSDFSSDSPKRFIAFAKFDSPQYLEPAGTRSYLTYHCKAHNKSFRIGIHTIRWNKKKTWATFENNKIDDLIGHPKKPVYDFGQAPIKF